MVVVVWIAVNVFAATLRWDPYPFILLNLAFSTQAAYAAPLILLAQNRGGEGRAREDVSAEKGKSIGPRAGRVAAGRRRGGDA